MQGKLFQRCTHLLYCFYPPRILNEHWCIYSCLQIPPRENWFQYVRRVYATVINFPCIITLCTVVSKVSSYAGNPLAAKIVLRNNKTILFVAHIVRLLITLYTISVKKVDNLIFLRSNITSLMTSRIIQ